MTKLKTNKSVKNIKGIRKHYHLRNDNKCYKNLKIISLTFVNKYFTMTTLHQLIH